MEVKGGYQHLGVRQEADGTVCSLLRPLVDLFFHWVSRRTKLVSLLTINFSALAILHLSTGNSFDFIPTFSPTSSFSLLWHIIEQDFSRNWNFLARSDERYRHCDIASQHKNLQKLDLTILASLSCLFPRVWWSLFSSTVECQHGETQKCILKPVEDNPASGTIYRDKF